jgi:hypothetical protein
MPTPVLPPGRPHAGRALSPICDPARGYERWSERASVPLLRELLRRHAELPSYGPPRFTGTRSERNELWKEYRNYIYQALSYFDAATNVSDRSACLLYYYAALNFAKAELLDTHASQIMNQSIGHGLSYNTTKAKQLGSDFVKVNASGGVFSLLYQRRVGRAIQSGQRLPILRLLPNIPEVSTQLADSGIHHTLTCAVFQMIASDGPSLWPILLTYQDVDTSGKTGQLFYRNFRQVQPHQGWHDHFGLSKRLTYGARLFESVDVVPCTARTPIEKAVEITWKLREILSEPVNAYVDGYITPSIYRSQMLPMPSSLARYAVMFYASSLVRYRPSLFDRQTYPQNAYLFDAIARECALPMLVDALNALEGKTQLFYSGDFFRV